jgi:Xaa-Pro aminopeptidase
MGIRQSTRFAARLVRARDAMRDAALDALVVSCLPNVQYLSGFAGSAGLLLLTPARCLLIVDFRYVTAARSVVASHAELSAAVTVVVARDSYDETLLEQLRDGGARRIGIEASWMSVSRFNRLSGSLAGSAPTPLESPRPCPALVPTERLVEAGRMIKDDDEIATLREAGRRLALVADELPELVRSGRMEIDVAADIESRMRARGFERPAFETIVASGPNGARPHARPGRRLLQEGDGVVLDFGGVYDGYCVDLSRTVQLGVAPQEFRRIFGAVADAQRAAIAAVRPGVAASAVDAAARSVLDGHGLAEAFGHSTGHGLGLEVHEEPRIGRPSGAALDVTLAPGMVFTVEPGAYVEGIGGVRIEDDVLVTETGCEVLTGPHPAGSHGG